MAEIGLKDKRHGNTRLSSKRGAMPYWHAKSNNKPDKIQNIITNVSDVGMFIEMFFKYNT